MHVFSTHSSWTGMGISLVVLIEYLTVLLARADLAISFAGQPELGSTRPTLAMPLLHSEFSSLIMKLLF